jgi:hypothetical protein
MIDFPVPASPKRNRFFSRGLTCSTGPDDRRWISASTTTALGTACRRRNSPEYSCIPSSRLPSRVILMVFSHFGWRALSFSAVSCGTSPAYHTWPCPFTAHAKFRLRFFALLIRNELIERIIVSRLPRGGPIAVPCVSECDQSWGKSLFRGLRRRARTRQTGSIGPVPVRIVQRS